MLKQQKLMATPAAAQSVSEPIARANPSLAGLRIVVTRSRDQSATFSQMLRERGAEVLELPAIKILPPEELEPLMEAIKGLNAYDWVIFTSANGVKSFFDIFFKRFQDLRDFGGARIAAVGPATASAIHALHLQVDVMPKEYVASQIAQALRAYESMENLRVLLPRAMVATPELPKLLENLGAIVDDIPCYRTVAETDHDPMTVESLLKQGADWITFTSGSSVDHFHARFNLTQLRSQFGKLKLASIGPETSQSLVQLDLAPDAEAKTHTLAGLVEVLEPKPGKAPRVRKKRSV